MFEVLQIMNRKSHYFTNIEDCYRSNLTSCRDSLIEKCDQMDKKFESMRNACQVIGKQIIFLCESYGGTGQNRKTKSSLANLVSTLSNCASMLGSSSDYGKVCLSWFNVENSHLSCMDSYINQLKDEILIPIEELIERIPQIDKIKKKIMMNTTELDDMKKGKSTKQHDNNSDDKSNDAANILNNESGSIDNYSLCIRMNHFVKIITNYTFKMHQIETDIAKLCFKILEIEQKFHSKVVEMMSLITSQVSKLNLLQSHKIFGKALNNHLLDYQCEIAVVINEAIAFLLMEDAILEEGIFRIASNRVKVQKLQAAYDSGLPIPKYYVSDVHVMAGLLKQYLRDIPNSLLCNNLNDEWINACKLYGIKRIEAIGEVIKKLPSVNYTNLRYLMFFLKEVVEQESVNKMSIMNISVVFGPTLLCESETDAPQLATGSSHVTTIVECILRNLELYFPDQPALNRDKFIRIVETVKNDLKEDKDIDEHDCLSDKPASDSPDTDVLLPPYQFYNYSAYNNVKLDK